MDLQPQFVSPPEPALGQELVRQGAVVAAEHAEVIGIDLSGVSVENAHRLAVREGVAHKVTHEIGDAEATGFADDRFDIITEYGSLHPGL